MGEYAVDQMMFDYKQMTGHDADRSDFEDDVPRKRPQKPRCPVCSKAFGTYLAVRQHSRDKHGPKAPKLTAGGVVPGDPENRPVAQPGTSAGATSPPAAQAHEPGPGVR